MVPTPEGLPVETWRYFALFVAVIVGIVTEPVPAAVVGLLGVLVAAAAGLVRPTAAQSAAWALSGFSNTTVWLIFAAYMFALGYSKTGLGKRIALHLIRLMGKRTLGLGYAVTLADLVLAPVTPSTTARSGGTIYPAIRSIPEIYGSYPNDESARKIGAYLLYTAAATTLVTSSMFITALAPNALALTFVAQVINVTISWWDWMIGFAPVGIVLLLLVPFLLYKIYPPGIKEAPDAPRWADAELEKMGPITRAEVTLLGLVMVALALWIGGGHYIEAAIAAVLVVTLMIVLRVVTWNEVIGNEPAWNILVWFATLLTLAGGLVETKFVAWLADAMAPTLSHLGPSASIVGLVGAFYVLHYFFASITAHTAALFPVFLGVAVTVPGVSPETWARLLCYSLGLMGILTPYAGAHMAVYYGSGYIKGRDFWVFGGILGAIYLATYLVIIVPWLAFLGV
jgi:L-tartrate/succinate antiporter